MYDLVFRIIIFGTILYLFVRGGSILLFNLVSSFKKKRIQSFCTDAFLSIALALWGVFLYDEVLTCKGLNFFPKSLFGHLEGCEDLDSMLRRMISLLSLAVFVFSIKSLFKKGSS